MKNNPKKKDNKKVFIWAFATLLLIGICTTLFLLRSSPRYSIYMLDKAAAERDIGEFEKYVNLDSVAEGLINQFIETCKVPVEGPDREKFKSELVIQFRKGIGEGEFAPRSFSNIFDAYTKTGVRKDQNGDVWVTFMEESGEFGSVRMRESGFDWTAIEMKLGSSSNLSSELGCK